MRAALLACALLLGAAGAVAQPGTLAGRVTATDGAAALAGASVRLRGTALGTAADSDGRFEITGIPGGDYEVVVSSVGFRTATRTIAVPTGGRAEIEVALEEEPLAAGEVVVAARRAQTATKSDAPVLLIPQSVVVVPAAVLEAQGARDVGRALRNVSGVAVASREQPFAELVLRGFKADPSGSFRRNGVEVAHYHDALRANVERVEVLKGPASVLYGRIEPGGVVNFVTAHPLAARRYEAEGEGGSYGTARARTDATGPVPFARDVRYRLIGSIERAGSFRDEVASSSAFAAPVLAGGLGRRVTWTVEGEVERAEAVMDPGIVVADSTLPDAFERAPFYGEPEATHLFRTLFGMSTVEVALGRGWGLRQTASAGRYTRDRPLVRIDSLLVEGRVARSFRREVSRYRYLQAESVVAGRLRTGALDHHLALGVEVNRLGIALSGEAPLVSEGDTVRFAALAPVPIDAPTSTGLPPAAERVEYVRADGVGWNVGAYAQHRLTAPLPRTLGGGQAHLVLAGRLSRVTAEAEWFALARTEDTPAGLNRREVAVTALTPSVGIVVEPRPGVSLYASYVRSFNPIFQQVDAQGRPFEPTRGEQVEAGAKAELLGGRLTATLAAFHLVKRGALSREPGGFYVQTGAQRSRGVEADVLGEPLPGLTVVGALTLLDAVVTEDEVIAAGNRLPGAARVSGRLWTEYRLQEGLLAGLALSGGVYALGSRFGTLRNDLEVPGYAIVDFGLAYAAGERAHLRLSVENALDADYVVSAARLPETGESPPLVNGWPGVPRTIRLTATVRR